jgi:hypothetical protein
MRKLFRKHVSLQNLRIHFNVTTVSLALRIILFVHERIHDAMIKCTTRGIVAADDTYSLY